MYKLLVPILLAITLSLLSTQSVAIAEIKVSPPLNWQPAPNNNSTGMGMAWFQNSTKSAFMILKVSQNVTFPLFLGGPFLAQGFADKGQLESVDQISFGRSNFGYRYFLNIASSVLPIFNGPNVLDVPIKVMLIVTQKQGDLYAITLLTPKENFDSKLNEIKPTLDSIQLSNSTVNYNKLKGY